MKRTSFSYIRKPTRIRNAARAVNRLGGKFLGEIDLRQETVEMLLSQALIQLPLNRGEWDGRRL